MPTLPAALKPTSSYSIGSPAGAYATETAGGPSRTGLYFERGEQAFSITFSLLAEQYSLWVLFFHRIVGLGTIPFTMPLDSGFGVQPHDVTVVPDSYSATRSGTVWIVTFQVRATNQAYNYTPDEAQAILDLYDATNGDVLRIVDGLHRLANVDSLVLDF